MKQRKEEKAFHLLVRADITLSSYSFSYKDMKKENAPYYHCEDRHNLCWNTCADYKEWKERRKEESQEEVGLRLSMQYLAERSRQINAHLNRK